MTLENFSSASYKIKHIPAIWYCQSAHRCIPKRNESVRSHKDLLQMFKATLNNSQKLKTIQISVNKWWINKSCTSTLCNTIQQQKEWNIGMCLGTQHE